MTADTHTRFSVARNGLDCIPQGPTPGHVCTLGDIRHHGSGRLATVLRNEGSGMSGFTLLDPDKSQGLLRTHTHQGNPNGCR